MLGRRVGQAQVTRPPEPALRVQDGLSGAPGCPPVHLLPSHDPPSIVQSIREPAEPAHISRYANLPLTGRFDSFATP